jgi:hypothetical protein
MSLHPPSFSSSPHLTSVLCLKFSISLHSAAWGAPSGGSLAIWELHTEVIGKERRELSCVTRDEVHLPPLLRGLRHGVPARRSPAARPPTRSSCAWQRRFPSPPTSSSVCASSWQLTTLLPPLVLHTCCASLLLGFATCCKSMFRMFRMFQKNIANFSCRCCKSRS